MCTSDGFAFCLRGEAMQVTSTWPFPSFQNFQSNKFKAQTTSGHEHIFHPYIHIYIYIRIPYIDIIIYVHMYIRWTHNKLCQRSGVQKPRMLESATWYDDCRGALPLTSPYLMSNHSLTTKWKMPWIPKCKSEDTKEPVRTCNTWMTTFGVYHLTRFQNTSPQHLNLKGTLFSPSCTPTFLQILQMIWKDGKTQKLETMNSGNFVQKTMKGVFRLPHFQGFVRVSKELPLKSCGMQKPWQRWYRKECQISKKRYEKSWKTSLSSLSFVKI